MCEGCRSFLERFGVDNGDETSEDEEICFDEIDSLEFKEKTFVLTGELKYSENGDDVKVLVVKAGGKCAGAVSGKTDYLVIGSAGNAGRPKIQKAKDYQENGKPIKIIT